MNKEPIGLYIFRFMLGFGLFAFMCMLYWSSVLIEQDMRVLRSDIGQLKNEIYALRGETDKVRDDVLRTILDEQTSWREFFRELITRPAIQTEALPPTVAPTAKSREMAALIKKRPYMDPSLSNLLSEDPFYAVTLPKLLGENFRPLGMIKGATVGKPDNLHPFTNWSQVSTWRGLCIPSLSRLQFGKYETMAPDLAIKIEERVRKDNGAPEYWVHLREKVYWQPLSPKMFPEQIELAPQFLRKHRVLASDFKFWFDALMNPYNQEPGAVSLRNYFGDIEEIIVIDKLTFVVRWKTLPVEQPDGTVKHKVKYVAKQLTGSLQPLPSFVYKYFADGTKIVEDDSDPETYRTNSVWANNFAQHWAKNVIVSCGAWQFDRMSDRQIKFSRNQGFYFPLTALTKGREVRFKNTPDAIWQDFKANKTDSYTVQPDQLIELDDFLNSPLYDAQDKAGQGIRRIDYLARSYSYIGWNQAKPFFKSTKVRQALTMAIDRERIIRQNLNGMAIQITGPFFRNSPSYDEDIAPWPFNPEQAKHLLEEDGWYDSDGDGVIDKLIDGKRVSFRFNLTYYVKNPSSKAICEYISTALKDVGIECNLNGVDIADLSASFDDKSFDALFLAWALGTPPEDPKQLWFSSGAKEKGSSNAVGFANAEADKIIDQLQFESNRDKRVGLYHRFHAIIHEEQPYTFLFTQKVPMVYRNRLQNVFIPADRQDLVPGANIAEPDNSVFWLKES